MRTKVGDNAFRNILLKQKAHEFVTNKIKRSLIKIVSYLLVHEDNPEIETTSVLMIEMFSSMRLDQQEFHLLI